MGKTSVTAMNEFIPYNRPSIGEEEIEGVVSTLRSGWLTMGQKTLDLEAALSEYTGAKYAVAVSSCTAALHLSLLGLGVGPGDEVITTPYTFAATGNVIIHAGAKPVFVDVEPDTANIDPDRIADAISAKTAAILPVHYAGQPAAMDAIIDLAEDHHLAVIEDAAHAIGATYCGQMIGTIGDATCFSFYATKNMTTGEGGAVTTDSEELAKRLQVLRLHGISRDAWNRYSSTGSWYYEIETCGWKYNMTDLQAAIGIPQLRRLDAFNARRRTIAALFNKGFSRLEGVTLPVERPDRLHIYQVYPLLLEEFDRGRFIEEMSIRGIGCSVHFIPLHLHSFYREQFGFRAGDYPHAERFYEREVSLPLYPSMEEVEVARIMSAVQEILEGDNCHVSTSRPSNEPSALGMPNKT